ncbi:hypothetical protein PWT90_11223 [Aphanocladium album]|nr:hypothetical protein PWT90_11223 [Aphanocladium album]
MAANAQTNAFWLSYAPAEQETFEDTLELIDKVLSATKADGPRHAFMAGELLRDGQRVVDAVVTTSTRVRLHGFLAKTKWGRKGARGEVRDVKWPKPQEGAHKFVQRWAEHMRQAAAMMKQRTELDEKSLTQLLSVQLESDRQRMRRNRGSTRVKTSRRGQTSDLVSSPHPEVSVTAPVQNGGVSSFDWSPHDFTGVEVDFDLGVDVATEGIATAGSAFDPNEVMMDLGLELAIDCVLFGEDAACVPGWKWDVNVQLDVRAEDVTL